MTSSLHALSNIAVCLFGLFLLSATGVIKASEISTGISWDLVLFIGTATSIGSVFIATGISSWLSEILVTAIAPIAGNPWLLVFSILPLMFLWRFVDIAGFMPTMAIISAVAPKVFSHYRIHPLVWVPLMCIVMSSFFLGYTNMYALMAESIIGERVDGCLGI